MKMTTINTSNVPTSFQSKKIATKSESATETKPDNDQDDSQKVSGETVKLSASSLKLSTSSPVKSSDHTPSLANSDQAKRMLNQLISGFQSNPSQAMAAQSNVSPDTAKLMLSNT